VFTIKSEFFKHIRELVKTMLVEHGGDSNISFDSGLIARSTIQVGKYDRVDLKRGVVDWHMHPDKCLDDSTCTIGLPSPMDLSSVVVGAALGNLAHILFSREGTYVIQLEAPVRRELHGDKEEAKFFSQYVGVAFEKWFKTTGKSLFEGPPGKGYAALQRKYIAHAKKLGFSVRFFKGNKIPKFKMKYNCALKQGGPGMTKV
jgi:hypothetical protein